ncbi:unnamed protein product, partial [Prorocentrum cordatum]
MRFTGSRVGLPFASNAIMLLLARWWLQPAGPAAPGAPAAAAQAAALFPPFEAGPLSAPGEAALIPAPLADCLAAALDAREAAPACPSPCPPCPSSEAGSGPRPSLAWEAALCGLLLLASELLRWGLSPASLAEAAPAHLRAGPLRMISVGDAIWVEYDEPGPRLAHKRMVVALSSRGLEHYAVFAPDFDVYVEECDAGNADI